MGVMHTQMKHKSYIKILPAERQQNKMNSLKIFFILTVVPTHILSSLLIRELFLN